MIEKSEIKKILDRLNTIKVTKNLSKEETVLINTHVKIIQEIISKNLNYEENLINIYNQIIEVYDEKWNF